MFAGRVKVVTRYPERTPSLDSWLMLMDIRTGENLAIMDANWITTMRTGAVAAHSIMLLAKDGYKNISIMGLGNTARAALLILAELNPEKQFNIRLLKYKDQENDFKERFIKYENLTFDFVETYQELMAHADVVISAVTYLEDDICPDNLYEEGVLVVPIHTRGFTNCDCFFDKVYADDTGHVHHFKNFERFKRFSEVHDVVNGSFPGRENDKERIIVYNIGLSIHDINYAWHIYEMIKGERELMRIDLKPPHEKFWI